MKYIIEIKPEYEDSFKGLMILGAKDSNLLVDTLAVENLEELNSDYINEHFSDLQDDAYNKGYAQCQDDYSDALKHAKDTAYKKGFEDGKAVHDKGCEGCMYNDGTKEHSPCDICCNAYLNRWTAKPQEDDKIEVGDEVVDSSGKKGLVVSDGNKCSDTIWLLINGYRVPQSVCKEDYTKTGRHFDIASILEAMKA